MKRLIKILLLTLFISPLIHANEFVKTNNDFGLKLLNQLNTEGENLCLSPYSIQSALGMTALGAKGNTLVEMKKALCYPQDGNIFQSKKLYDDELSKSIGRKVELMTANRIFIDKTLSVKAPYLNDTKTYFGSTVDRVDFLKQPDKERKKINNWVEKQTNKRIKDLILAGGIDPTTAMVLTNAIYFKAPWTNKFKASATYQADFENANGNTGKASYMSASETYHYVSAEKYSALSIPYGKAEEVQFLVVLPNRGQKLDDVVVGLGDKELIEITKAQKVSANLSLPKIKHEGESIDLSKVLIKMGIKDAFGSADFSGISDEPLAVDKVFHKTFLEIDEKGGEAAAATAVLTLRGKPIPELKFTVDRPFFYAIQDSKTGLCLFMGVDKNL